MARCLPACLFRRFPRGAVNGWFRRTAGRCVRPSTEQVSVRGINIDRPIQERMWPGPIDLVATQPTESPHQEASDRDNGSDHHVRLGNRRSPARDPPLRVNNMNKPGMTNGTMDKDP